MLKFRVKKKRSSEVRESCVGKGAFRNGAYLESYRTF